MPKINCSITATICTRSSHSNTTPRVVCGSFVTKNIWPRLKDRDDMWCGRKKRPIIDLTIYTRNRVFRIPGSSKWDDYHPRPLPSKQFLIDTRMADRRTKPDLLTSQLTHPKLMIRMHSFQRVVIILWKAVGKRQMDLLLQVLRIWLRTREIQGLWLEN